MKCIFLFTSQIMKHNFFIYQLFIIVAMLSKKMNAECPFKWKQDTKIQDFVMLMDRVSWTSDTTGQIIDGRNGSYLQIAQSDGVYDTRMRVYTSNDKTIFFIFRPTQQDGWTIHQDIKLVSIQFLSAVLDGFVHERFQEAFMSLLQNMPSDVLQNIKIYKKIYIGGHSLGGALSIFMLMHLVYNIGIIPDNVIGLAGPFIGDDIFDTNFQKPLQSLKSLEWFQVYTQIVSSTNIKDETILGYNSSYPPFIYYNDDLVCTFSIPTQVPDSYGMHDIKNYISWFRNTQS